MWDEIIISPEILILHLQSEDLVKFLKDDGNASDINKGRSNIYPLSLTWELENLIYHSQRPLGHMDKIEWKILKHSIAGSIWGCKISSSCPIKKIDFIWHCHTAWIM